MITSAYSKSSNFSGFNPILQKFCDMICEVTVYKIYWFFVNRASTQISWKNIFLFEKKLFQRLGAFFLTAKPLIWASFFPQKIKFILFFKCDYLILIQYWKHGLKVVSATFLLGCLIYLKESTCETRRNAFYFTSKALLILEIIKF